MQYELINTCLLVATVAVVLNKGRAYFASGGESNQSFVSFRQRYLIVYFLVMAGDWLQGPYVYALYDKYGMKKEDIASLFVIGFGSSMVFGTFIGSLADSWGRKKFCVLYCILYIASCVTKHVNDFNILLIGRLLGGMATSLLFSVFESWLVCESQKNGFSGELLGSMFSLSVFGNSLVAITCGYLAQSAADYFPFTSMGESSIYFGGYTAPFDLAIIALTLAGFFITVTWNENFGDSNRSVESQGTSFNDALLVVLNNRAILLLGLVQSLFEGAMYSFVFMWSPALTPSDPEAPAPPFGVIFSSFMICCMLGSQLYGYLAAVMSPEKILRLVFFVGALSLGTVEFDQQYGTSMTYIGFLMFEVCVGIYFPCQGSIKGNVVPELYRSTIYNIFRIPLNAIVLFVLLNNFSVQVTFMLCTGLLFTAMILQHFLVQISESENRYKIVPSHN